MARLRRRTTRPCRPRSLDCPQVYSRTGPVDHRQELAMIREMP